MLVGILHVVDHIEPGGMILFSHVVVCCRNNTVVEIDVHCHAGVELFQIVYATGIDYFGTCFVQCRQQHGGENCDDRNNDEQFNKGKRTSYLRRLEQRGH